MKTNEYSKDLDVIAGLTMLLGDLPHTYQDSSAYWDALHVDTKEKVIYIKLDSNYGNDLDIKIVWAITGLAINHGYIVEELIGE